MKVEVYKKKEKIQAALAEKLSHKVKFDTDSDDDKPPTNEYEIYRPLYRPFRVEERPKTSL